MDSYNQKTGAGGRHEQAAYHFSRLRSPQKTDADTQAFEAWLVASAENRAAFDEIDQLWLKSSDLRSSRINAPELTPNIQRVQKHIAELKSAKANSETLKRRRFQPVWALAATLLIAIGAVLWFNPGLYNAGSVERYYTGVGEQKTIRLSDGTRVTLNTRSTIDAAFDRHERRVILLRGQARFDVAPNSHQPFVVEINDARVSVLGTEFDIYKRPGLQAGDDQDEEGMEIIVTLLGGVVEVSRQLDTDKNSSGGDDSASQNAMEKTRLKPGQQVVVTRSQGLSPVRVVDLNTVDAWRQGKLKFSETPLQRVIAEANRYGGYQLVLVNSQLAGHKISGVFESGDNQGLARSLQALLDVDIKTRGEKIIEIY